MSPRSRLAYIARQRYIRVVKPSYEFFDHTADMGIRVRAATLPELLEPAARGLYAVIGDLTAGADSEPVRFDLSSNDPAFLLRDYLAELLVLFECDARIVTAFDVSIFNDHRLTATGQARLVDPRRSAYHHEVKAITYHELEIRSIPGGYEATIIVDI